MTNLVIFWHRRDLRVSDNIGLSNAYKYSSKLIGLFCLDTQILNRDDMASARVAYLLGCLKELQESYQKLGSQLLIIQGNPAQIIPKLAETLQAKAVFWNEDVEPYSKIRDRQVIDALKEKGIQSQTYWDQLLHAPGDILTKSSQEPYKVYTPFWKNLITENKASIAHSLNQLQPLTAAEINLVKEIGIINLPTAKDLGYCWDSPLIFSPGEKAAKEQLSFFCDQAIYEYQEQRNLPASEGTSKLSAALKFGAIGIREVWQATVNAMKNSRSDEARENIQTWQKELAWREFYQHCLYFFPELAEGPYRPEFKEFPWDNNEEDFQAWCEGKTGYPIVDAAMRQLNETGWMHNRCRMIVASFLTKDLIINWQWGEKYFMQKLIDGDLSANNGGWQWSASSGMDPKPLRIFNPATQAQKFDPEGEYIRQWLPELSSLDNEYLVTGKISPLDCQSCAYPQPIVDHQKQQREFKERYKQIKS
ncbi:FAD-binding domain-containing protein [Aphanothece sacrum]|uniref:Deoxyribodipyrimidine photo-lyase n=1 Tax=Aphanothece sacrum FPU1 TaxID=1920663 RepID=A0A401IH40_APHSA|nr:FAD-binding domain-containing protein [Aphanothece sacrum]GBF80603.1 deoxyribopyrimidine photolyase [Aphanothece sacrum FPU1]GBF84007.1 deoxyribopyrimidine photolyase [Aphanothece sacrum FPU3]